MSDEEFEHLVFETIDGLPHEFREKLDNVAVTIADQPTLQQMRQLRLRPWTLLFGLYEGVSLQGRASNYTSILPDKITIFKQPILSLSQDPDAIKNHVRSVVLHEIAHHFGFSEQRIREVESRSHS